MLRFFHQRWSRVLRESDRGDGERDEDRPDREAGDRPGVDGAEQQLTGRIPAGRHQSVDRQQPTPVLTPGELVQPSFGDNVLAGETQPGDESEHDPRRGRDDQSKPEDRRRQYGGERGVHANVADLVKRLERQSRPDQKPGVVGGADHADHASRKVFQFRANAEQGGE